MGQKPLRKSINNTNKEPHDAHRGWRNDCQFYRYRYELIDNQLRHHRYVIIMTVCWWFMSTCNVKKRELDKFEDNASIA